VTSKDEDSVLEKSTNEYSTTDFYTTAVLISQNFIVVEVTKEGHGGKVKRFHFKKTPELQKIVMDYINGKLEGNIRIFRNAIETVKDMVYSSN
jgi:predicted secreted protein